jgi:hypothetical protein
MSLQAQITQNRIALEQMIAQARSVEQLTTVSLVNRDDFLLYNQSSNNFKVKLGDLFSIISINDVVQLGATLTLKADLVNGLVPNDQLPSFVDDVLEGQYISASVFNDEAGDPYPNEAGKIYVDVITDPAKPISYRWGGSSYIRMTSDSAIWGNIGGTIALQTDLISLFDDVAYKNIDNNFTVSQTFGLNINILNGNKIYLGTGNTASISADAIDVTFLNETNNGAVSIQAKNGAGTTQRYFYGNGQTESATIYFAGSEKLATTSSGINVSGEGIFTSANGFPLILSKGLDVNIEGDSGAYITLGSLDGSTYKSGANISGTLMANGDDGRYNIYVRSANAMVNRYEIDSDGNHDFKTGTVAIGGAVTIASSVSATVFTGGWNGGDIDGHATFKNASVLNFERSGYNTRQLGIDSTGFYIYDSTRSAYVMQASELGAVTFISSLSATDGLFSGNLTAGTTTSIAKLTVRETTANSEYASMGSGSTTDRHLKFSGFVANGSNNTGHRLSVSKAIALNVDGVDALYINDDQSAIFASSVSATKLLANSGTAGSIFKSSTTGLYNTYENSNKQFGFIGTASQTVSGGAANDFGIQATDGFEIATGGNTKAFRLNSDLSAEFASSVSATDGIFSGKVAIGTTIGSFALEVNGGISDGLKIQAGNSVNDDSLLVTDNAGNSLFVVKGDGESVFASSVSAGGYINASSSLGAAFISQLVNTSSSGHGLLIQAGGTSGARYIIQAKDALGNVRLNFHDTGEFELTNTIQAAGYKSSDGSDGVTTSYDIVVGDTLVFKNGIITDVIQP